MHDFNQYLAQPLNETINPLDHTNKEKLDVEAVLQFGIALLRAEGYAIHHRDGNPLNNHSSNIRIVAPRNSIPTYDDIAREYRRAHKRL